MYTFLIQTKFEETNVIYKRIVYIENGPYFLIKFGLFPFFYKIKCGFIQKINLFFISIKSISN